MVLMNDIYTKNANRHFGCRFAFRPTCNAKCKFFVYREPREAAAGREFSRTRCAYSLNGTAELNEIFDYIRTTHDKYKSFYESRKVRLANTLRLDIAAYEKLLAGAESGSKKRSKNNNAETPVAAAG